MRFALIAAALFSTAALAADHMVTVGANQSLAFSPNNITAAVGDTVTFMFMGKNHSVTQSTFAKPCSIMTTPAVGVDSGFHLTEANATTFASWQITVENASVPLWFYCAQTVPKVHCSAGMVFSVNAPPAKPFSAYLQNALNTANTTTAASANSTVASVGATSASGGVPPSSVGASSSSITPVAGANNSATSSMTTSVGVIATSSVPTAASGLSGAAVTGNSSPTSGAVANLPGTTGLLLAALVAGLMI